MIPSTPRGREVAGTELTALTFARAFLPHVASARAWTGRLDDADGNRMLDLVRARLDADGRERVMVVAALARQAVAGLMPALHDASLPAAVAWLNQRVDAMTGHEHGSEAAAARIVLAVTPELQPGVDAVEDAPAAIAELLDDDWWETLLSLAMFTAGMFLHAFGSVEQATRAIDAQAEPLLP